MLSRAQGECNAIYGLTWVSSPRDHARLPGGLGAFVFTAGESKGEYTAGGIGGGVAGSRYRLQDSSPSGLTQDALNCLATSSDSVGNVSQGKFDRDPNARVFTGDWLHRCPLPGPYQTF